MEERRARIGLIYPADGTLDDEYWRLVPVGVTVHITRVALLSEDMSVESVTAEAESEEIESAAARLSVIRPDVIAYACSSGSFIGGVGFDRRIISRIEEASGAPATTTSTAVVEALRALGVSKVAVATPYAEDINLRLRAFLEGSGIQVVGLKGLQVTRDIGMIGSESAYRLAIEAHTPGAEAVFISCTAFRTVDILEQLEQDLSKPVVTANQATMWECLRLAGVSPRVKGVGRLYLI